MEKPAPQKRKMMLTIDKELRDAIQADADRLQIPAATLAASRLRQVWLDEPQEMGWDTVPSIVKQQALEAKPRPAQSLVRAEVTPRFKKGKS